MTPRGSCCLLLVTALLLLASFPVSAQADESSASVSGVILGLPGVPDLMQENSKLQYTWVNFKQDGEKAAESGNYEEAIKNYNMAEALLLEGDPNRYASTESSLSNLESLKSGAFKNWGGHDAEAAKSSAKSAELKASADAKYKSENSGKCLIVTATFGSPLASEVQLVRSFRDDSIAKSYTGSRFMPGFNAWYYSFSPQVSGYINEHPIVRPAMQVLITPILEIVLFAQICYTTLSFNRELATIAAIIIGSALFGLIYVFPTTMAGVWVARRNGWNGADVRSLWPAAFLWGALLLLIIVGGILSLDLLTTISSGLFVIATIIMVVAALSLSLSRYIGRKDAAAQE
jgi:hypothetical protein